MIRYYIYYMIRYYILYEFKLQVLINEFYTTKLLIEYLPREAII